MTEEDIRKLELKYSEMKIQHTCVEWFRITFPTIAGLLFAIPNGGMRSKKSGAMRKYEGAIAGVSDLILLFPKQGKAALCIEMKIPKEKGKRAGTQSDSQKAWQELIQSNGSAYVVCHGIIEFIECICVYMNIDPRPYKAKLLQTYFKLI